MRVALGVTVYWSIVSVIFMVLAYIFNLKRAVKQQQKQAKRAAEMGMTGAGPSP